LLIFTGLLVSIGAGCSQLFYCKLFRLETASIGSSSSFSRELLDGKFGTFENYDLFIRVVAVWDSNNPKRLANNAYSITISQRSQKKVTDTLLIDSVDVTFLPSGEHHTVLRHSIELVKGYNVPGPRVITRFSSIVIPPDVSAIEISFAARQAARAAEAAQSYTVKLVRFEGVVRKLGHVEID
ncbi:hypothetical protein C3F09_07565, partial [candidate division GN15 bacterium]